jgi:subtilisin-like proprotein convertase family protein
MKQVLLVFLCTLGISFSIQAQVVNFQDGQTTTDCNYLLVKQAFTSPTATHIVCPEGNGSLASLLFQEILLTESQELVVYDGITTTSGTLLQMTGMPNQQPASGITTTATVANSDNGCLLVQCNVPPGTTAGVASFLAFVTCQPACATPIVIDFENDGIVGVDSISLCNGITPNLDITAYSWSGTNIVNVSDSVVSLQWMVGSNLYADFGAIPLNNYGPFQAFSIVDISLNGCTQTVIKPLHVFIAHEPLFFLSDQIDTVYLGESIDLTAYFDNAYPYNTLTVLPGDNLNTNYNSVQTLALPDGTGVAYADTLVVQQGGSEVFSNSTTFEVCVNMEHSWLHDLYIWIECPNGQICTLQNQSFNGFCNLGIPIDGDGQNPTGGVGFTYCWNAQSPLGDFTEEFLAGNTLSINNQPTLAPGEYTPYEDSFDALNGCPIEGVWSLSIFDNWGSDNGFIFEWGISFSDDSIADPTISSYAWAPNTDIQAYSADSATITAIPSQLGLQQYAFSATSSAGCTADTVVPVFVIPVVVDNNVYSCGSQINNSLIDSTTFSAGQLTIQTICPSNPDSFVQIVLIPFGAPSANNIIVYDGNDINNPVLFDLSTDMYEDTVNVPQYTLFATAANTDNGCLTITTEYPTYTETTIWSANITCNQACQTFTFAYANAENGQQFTDHTVLICPFEVFNVDAIFDFQQNNVLYQQSAETTEVIWFANGDSIGSGNNIEFAFNPGQVYQITATATDQNNCMSTLEDVFQVYALPTFNFITNVLPFYIADITDSIVIEASLGSLQGNAQISISEGIFSNLPDYDVPNITSLNWMAPNGTIGNISTDSAAYLTILPFATEFPLTIVAQNELGCQMTFDFVPTVLVGDQSLPDNLYTVSPNPTATETQIIGLTSEVLVNWYDAQGRIVDSKTASPTDNIFDISAWPSGVYMYKITNSAGKMLTGRLLKD